MNRLAIALFVGIIFVPVFAIADEAPQSPVVAVSIANMPESSEKEALKARAAAVGLDETATEAQVLAAETAAKPKE